MDIFDGLQDFVKAGDIELDLDMHNELLDIYLTTFRQLMKLMRAGYQVLYVSADEGKSKSMYHQLASIPDVVRYDQSRVVRKAGKGPGSVRCVALNGDMLEHIKNQHPEFGSGEPLRIVRLAYGLTQKDLADELGLHPGYISSFENRRPVPVEAKQTIDWWLEDQAG